MPRDRLGAVYAREKRTFRERLPALLERRAARKEAPYTLRGLARELGVDHAHLSRIIGGQAKPALGLILRAAEILGVAYLEFPEMRAAFVNERIERDPDMRDRLFIEVYNWKEDPEPPPPGAGEAGRYQGR